MLTAIVAVLHIVLEENLMKISTCTRSAFAVNIGPKEHQR